MQILMVRIRIKADHLKDFIGEMIGDGKGSVLHEPGCRRFDIIQDEDEPTKLGLCEVYNDEAAVEDHMSRAHFKKWLEKTAGWTAEETGVSKCRCLFPAGDGHWDAARSTAVESAAFDRGLYVIHAPVRVKADRVQDFIGALCLDGVGAVNQEPGCLRFNVFQNRDNPTELYLYEVYVNKAAFEYHTRTPHFERWLETVKNWYAPGFSLEKSTDIIRGANVWPPDNWNWRSGKPTG
jgi:(4S)-4-hydroxy-5-phosphonooxypentane-2,3-dione isomerase